MAKSKKKNKSTFAAAVAALIGVIAIGGAGTAIVLNKQSAGTKEHDSNAPAESSAQTASDAPAPADIDLASIQLAPDNGMTARARVLTEHYNSDLLGWITVPHTDVDNPIVIGADNDFYLNHGFDHQEFRAGTVFMDFRNRLGFADEDQSDNLVLYGHNMKDNTMFGSLRKYRLDLEFYKEAPFIELDTNYQHYTYVIFALSIADGRGESDWRFWDMEDFADEASFNAFVDPAREKSLVDIPVDVKYGDKLITLCTCVPDEYETDNSRFLVIGRRLRPGESPEDFKKVLAAE